MNDEKRITYDADSGITVQSGDVLMTQKGIARLVVSARRVNGKYPNRWALRVVKVERPSPKARLLTLRWYPRRKKANG